MSFESWTQSGAEISLHGAFEAGRAEGEAEIATALAELHTLRTQQTSMILEMSALQLERDALMEAIEVYERLLSTPASGEPARKA